MAVRVRGLVARLVEARAATTGRQALRVRPAVARVDVPARGDLEHVRAQWFASTSARSVAAVEVQAEHLRLGHGRVHERHRAESFTYCGRFSKARAAAREHVRAQPEAERAGEAPSPSSSAPPRARARALGARPVEGQPSSARSTARSTRGGRGRRCGPTTCFAPQRTAGVHRATEETTKGAGRRPEHLGRLSQRSSLGARVSLTDMSEMTTPGTAGRRGGISGRAAPRSHLRLVRPCRRRARRPAGGRGRRWRRRAGCPSQGRAGARAGRRTAAQLHPLSERPSAGGGGGGSVSGSVAAARRAHKRTVPRGTADGRFRRWKGCSRSRRRRSRRAPAELRASRRSAASRRSRSRPGAARSTRARARGRAAGVSGFARVLAERRGASCPTRRPTRARANAGAERAAAAAHARRGARRAEGKASPCIVYGQTPAQVNMEAAMLTHDGDRGVPRGARAGATCCGSGGSPAGGSRTISLFVLRLWNNVKATRGHTKVVGRDRTHDRAQQQEVVRRGARRRRRTRSSADAEDARRV